MPLQEADQLALSVSHPTPAQREVKTSSGGAGIYLPRPPRAYSSWGSDDTQDSHAEEGEASLS